MENQLVRDIMIPLDQYPHVPAWFTLLQVMDVMENSKIEFHGRKSLPRVVLVFDLDSRLHGLVRRRDIMRGLEPEFLTSKKMDYRKKLFDVDIDPNLAELSYDKVLRNLKDRAERLVSDVMLPIETTVDHDDHITRVIYEMVDKNLSLIPVMEDKTVIGVVRSVDVFHEIAEILLSGKREKQ